MSERGHLIMVRVVERAALEWWWVQGQWPRSLIGWERAWSVQGSAVSVIEVGRR